MPESLRRPFAQLIQELGSEDPRLVVMVGDISHGIFTAFREDNPHRYFNIGILEQSMVGMAAGLAMSGLNPVVHTITPFLIERAYEQIKLDFGYQKLDVNLVSVGSTFDYSQLGVSHHSYSDVSMVGAIPGSQVFMPGSPEELEGLFRRYYSRPGVKYFRLTEFSHGIDDVSIQTDGRATRIKEGKDLTLVSTRGTVDLCMSLTQSLRSELDIEVVYVNSIKPFDAQTVKISVAKTTRVLTVEDLSAWDGLHNRVLQSLQSSRGWVSDSVAIEGYIHSYGTYGDLLMDAGLTLEILESKVRDLMAI